jgi:hypothetical protein
MYATSWDSLPVYLQIASYHAPGKYMLKEGVTYAKPSPNSGR